MAMYQPKSYKKKNRETGLWEEVIPPMVDLNPAKKIGIGSGNASKPMRAIVSVRIK